MTWTSWCAARVLPRAAGPVSLLQHRRGRRGGVAMLQGNPVAVCARPPSVCLVADGPGCLTPADGAGPSRAGQFRDAGREVHVLYCGPGAAAARRRAWQDGLGFSTLDDAELPGPFRTPNVFGDCHA